MDEEQVNLSRSSSSAKYIAEEVEVKEKHWFRDNWVLLSLMSAVFFALSNMFVGDLTKKGFESYYYWGSGSLLVSSAYFIY